MNYLIDLGYRKKKLVFGNLEQANKFANEVIRQTGEVLAILPTNRKVNVKGVAYDK